MLPPSRVASFFEGVIQGTMLSPVVYSFPFFRFFVEGFLSSTKLDYITLQITYAAKKTNKQQNQKKKKQKTKQNGECMENFS